VTSNDRLIVSAQNVIAGREPHDGAAIASYLEDEIVRRGLQERYIEALYPIIGAWQYGMSTSEQWRILRATPEQRARAFMAVIEASNADT
jgi:hypothetical protein